MTPAKLLECLTEEISKACKPTDNIEGFVFACRVPDGILVIDRHPVDDCTLIPQLNLQLVIAYGAVDFDRRFDGPQRVFTHRDETEKSSVHNLKLPDSIG